MPQKGEDHRSNHITTKKKIKKRGEGGWRKRQLVMGNNRSKRGGGRGGGAGGGGGGGEPINQSHDTKNIQSHDNYMVITDTQGDTKPPGRTHGLRPAHETARTLRHHYERKSCERVKDAYSIPHPVPPKITPRARMVPATAPISLLVATLTVQREKEHYYHPVKNKQQASASESWMM